MSNDELKATGISWVVDVKNKWHSPFFDLIKSQKGMVTGSAHAPGSSPSNPEALTFIKVTMPAGWLPDDTARAYGPWTRSDSLDIVARPEPATPGASVGNVLVGAAVVGGLGYLLLRLARSRPSSADW